MSVDFHRPCSLAGASHAAIARSVSEDLGRLDAMLDDAMNRLGASFSRIQRLAEDRNQPDIVLEAFDAMVALQFQDMAAQLIAHCRRCLADGEHDDPTATVPFVATHFNRLPQGPVDQGDMTSGSIELF